MDCIESKLAKIPSFKVGYQAVTTEMADNDENQKNEIYLTDQQPFGFVTSSYIG